MALRKNRRTIYEFVILELILHDFAEHILDIKTCCTNLLRNETGNGHTWSGIDLQHVHLVFTILILRDDIVDTDDTVGMKNVVDAGCGLGYLFCSLRRETAGVISCT